MTDYAPVVLDDPASRYLVAVEEPHDADDFTYARIVADSVAPDGTRITTWEKRHHRWVLAEENTHATPSKNSASSRARPVGKVIDDVRAHPAVPAVWAAEQSGMQGGEPLPTDAVAVARRKWDMHREATIRLGHELRDLGVHKSITNRLLEPHSMHVSVWTATAIGNYFDQRCHPDAQPEIRRVAEKMRAAYEASTPRPVAEGEWHLPYITQEDREQIVTLRLGNVTAEQALTQVSAARVARTSYLTQDGRRDLTVDLALYARLADHEPPHWSPLEQVATPCPENRQTVDLVTAVDGLPLTYPTDHLPKVGKYVGWLSLRHIVEAQRGQVTFR